MLRIGAGCLFATLLGCSGGNEAATNGGSGMSAGGASAGGTSSGGTPSKQGGTGGIAGDASATSGAGGVPAQTTQPNCGPGCFPLCQGGVCQCECSPIQGCDSPGWQLHTMSWDKFAHPDLTGGVELCLPQEWVPTETGGATFSDGQHSLSVSAEVRLDHPDALQRLSDTDGAHCMAQDYEFTIGRAGTLPAEQWPTLMQTYREMPPACGACPNGVPATDLNLVANVSIAYGEYLLTTYASAPESLADAATVIAIGRTARTQTDLAPMDTGTEIGDLFTQHAAQCP